MVAVGGIYVNRGGCCGKQCLPKHPIHVCMSPITCSHVNKKILFKVRVDIKQWGTSYLKATIKNNCSYKF